MRGDAAAYQTLGLEPGADQEAIDGAYRVLIKRYHPDRAGGDAARASAINEAYFRLRKAVGQPAEQTEPVSVAEALYARRASRLRRRRQKKKVPIWPALLLLLALPAFLQREKLAIVFEDVWAGVQSMIEPSALEGSDAAGQSRQASLDEPVSAGSVADAVGLATALHRSGNEDALVERSRACHQDLRAEPTLERLDGCAAFDNAVLELQRRDPLRDEGPFGASPSPPDRSAVPPCCRTTISRSRLAWIGSEAVCSCF
jgi:hypothetical protein